MKSYSKLYKTTGKASFKLDAFVLRRRSLRDSRSTVVSA